MWVISPSLTYTSCPQPTAQYGQIDCTTLSASSMRGFNFAERGDCTAGPRPSASPCRSWRRTGQDAINEPSATAFFLPRPRTDKQIVLRYVCWENRRESAFRIGKGSDP